MICEVCRQPLVKHRLTVTLHNDHVQPAEMRQLAHVCSIRCLVAWGHAYGVVQMRRGVAMVQGLVRNIVDAFKR